MFSPSLLPRALLVALLCSPAFAARSDARADDDAVSGLKNILYNKGPAFFVPLHRNGTTYLALVDNHQGDLFLNTAKPGNGSNVRVTIAGLSNLHVEGKQSEAFIQYYEEKILWKHVQVTDWPKNLTSAATSPFRDAVIGFDMGEALSAPRRIINSTFASNPDKFYNDWLITKDWKTSSKEIETAGVYSIGEVIDLKKILPISESDAAAVPTFTAAQIAALPEIKYRDGESFYFDPSLGINGRWGSLLSNVKANKDKTQAVGLVTTHETWNRASKPVVDALYKDLPGAKWVERGNLGIYEVDCVDDKKVTLAFNFGGKNYTLDGEELVMANPFGSKCVGTFSTPANAQAAEQWDFALGTTGLSAFYTRFGWNSKEKYQYIKLLQLDDLEVPHGANPSSGPHSSSSSGEASSAPTVTLTPIPSPTSASSSSGAASSGAGTVTLTPIPSPTSTSSGDKPAVKGAVDLSVSDEDKQKFNLAVGNIAEQLRHCLPAIILGAVVFGLLALIGLCVCLIRRRRSARKAPSAYRTLHEAEATGAQGSLYDAEGGRSRYADPYSDK